jgi:serine/threonine protein phosphatase PrpC
MTFHVDIGHSTHPGRRPNNEDFAGCALPAASDEARGLIAAIADGVSGGGGGLEAAQTSVLGIVADYHATPSTWDTTVVLDRLIAAQNAWLADHNRRRQNAPGEPGATAIAMTTLTALVLRGHAWTLAHLGDTRAWLLRGETFAQLTNDHAFEEAFQRSRLTRAIGLDDGIRIDFEQGELRAGDVFVLTTDGVHGVLGRAPLRRLAESADAQTASRLIVEAAVKAGTRDNATALVIRVGSLDAGSFEDTLLPARGLPVPRLLRAGDVLDGFTVIEALADTGVHLLYKARCEATGAAVVLKTLAPSRGDDAQERAMLLHESWLASRVATQAASGGEAGFVRALPVEQPSAFYTAFEWIAGSSLATLLASEQRSAVADIAAGGLAIARALARLHRHGVIHRDIKPDNLLLGEDGHWRVLDLGAAVSGSDPPALRGLHAGTPSYMNPEQWGGDGAQPLPADPASDVFALGVTLYEWLTGKLPYGDVEPYQRGRFRRDPKPPSRLRPDVPIWFDEIVLKAVALERARRFDSAEELVVALERASARPRAIPHATPLIARDPAMLLKIALGCSVLLNALLVYWLLFLPR